MYDGDRQTLESAAVLADDLAQAVDGTCACVFRVERSGGRSCESCADLISDRLRTDRLELTVLGATVSDGEPDTQVAAEAVVALGAALADVASAYAEVDAYPQDGGTPVLAGGGVLLRVSPDVQLDASFNVGLTDEAPDLLFGAGLSFRL